MTTNNSLNVINFYTYVDICIECIRNFVRLSKSIYACGITDIDSEIIKSKFRPLLYRSLNHHSPARSLNHFIRHYGINQARKISRDVYRVTIDHNRSRAPGRFRVESARKALPRFHKHETHEYFFRHLQPAKYRVNRNAIAASRFPATKKRKSDRNSTSRSRESGRYASRPPLRLVFRRTCVKTRETSGVMYGEYKHTRIS